MAKKAKKVKGAKKAAAAPVIPNMQSEEQKAAARAAKLAEKAKKLVASSPFGDRLVRAKPVTPGQRHLVRVVRPYLWKGKPVRELTLPLRKSGGRGHNGRIAVRHRGGGHKRRYRIIDFKRSVLDVPGKVLRFEYDPNRSANIALVSYPDGKLIYMIAPQELTVGDEVVASREREIELKPGNALTLANMPIGTYIHNVELRPGKGGQLCRSAGTVAQIMEKNLKPGYALVRLASKEQRLINMNCMATVGAVSNPLFQHRKLGKAGRARWLGIRPSVRGIVMNPVDHPHGGGEGKGGPGRPSCSPTGVLAKGFRTRPKRKSNKYIMVRRDGTPLHREKAE